jgi:hypothetical protein
MGQNKLERLGQASLIQWPENAARSTYPEIVFLDKIS